jgi:hypothetical protein
MNYRPLLTLLLSAALFTGCDKDKDEDPQPDFSPSTAGSTWTYQTNTGQSYTVTATDRDSTALGRSYRVFTTSTGINQYRTKSGADYYRFGMVPGLGSGGFEELYLKDNQAVNALWQAAQTINVPGVPIPLQATLQYTIKEQGATRTVAGKSFTNVTKVRLDISVFGVGAIGGGDFYYAAGIGMIESSLLISAQGQVLANTSELLTSYTIK